MQNHVYSYREIFSGQNLTIEKILYLISFYDFDLYIYLRNSNIRCGAVRYIMKHRAVPKNVSNNDNSRTA